MSQQISKTSIALKQKNDGQSFECSILMPTSNLLTYELPHTSLSSSTKPIISKGSPQNSSQSPMGKGSQYSMGCFSSRWDVHISWVVPHSSMVVHNFNEHHLLAYNHETFYPTLNLPCG
jgi:hypothetical protein